MLIIKLNYIDVYFNNESVIGFKGTSETKAKNNSDKIFKRLNNYIASNKNFKLIKLSNNDKSVLNNEYESNDIIIGIRYEKLNKYITIMSIYKKESLTFYDKIFYSEFLNLTKFRDKNSQIKSKELNVLPSESEKDFYRQKINEIKEEYNKNQ